MPYMCAQSFMGTSVLCLYLMNRVRVEKIPVLPFLKPDLAFPRVSSTGGAGLEKPLLLLITISSNCISIATVTTPTCPSHPYAHEMLGVAEWGSSVLASEQDSDAGARGGGVWLGSSRVEWTWW